MTTPVYKRYTEYWDPNKSGVYSCPLAENVIQATKNDYCQFLDSCSAKKWCDSDPKCAGYGLTQNNIHQASNNVVTYNKSGFQWFQKTSFPEPLPPPPAPAEEESARCCLIV